MKIKYISAMILLVSTSCVPMSKDTGSDYDSGNASGTELPGCMITTYCYEASWLTESNCASGFEFLVGGCPTDGIIGECAVNSGGDYDGSATGYYYEGQTDPEGACWDYGNGGTYTAY
jgi:hypothetical protein